ncbi:MAG TPA: MarR family transcriptional regulator [Stellaceae bacterium]|jgi:DNA-binding MarR family transcriptional regulator
MPATVKVESGKRPRRETAPARRVPPPEPKLGALQGFIGFNLRLAQDASFRVFARKSGQRDIMPGRFAALMVLRDNPNITQSALGRAIARDKSSVTPLLQDLQRRGLVKRMRSTTDRRSVTLTLTAAGARVLQDLILHAREHDRKLDEIAGPSKAEFVAILRRIADHMV